MQTALISVSDKTGIVEFAAGLVKLGFRILSTGGTAALLRKNKLPVTDVADVTGFPEILGGRVKTLHPKVFGGILADSSAAHAAELRTHEIGAIDLVCVNLYPFAETIAQPKITLAKAIEEIDIGGVSLLRAAAKNFERVLVVSKADQYAEALSALANPKLPKEERAALYRRYAAAAFAVTTKYDGMIASYLGGETYFTPIFEQAKPLRYGENPHQSALLYRDPDRSFSGVTSADVLQGKELSYNNLVDADVAWQLVADFTAPTASVIKHACPCGAATAKTIDAALHLALEADKKSPFGGIIAVNRPFTKSLAERTASLFLELIIAPSFEPAALKILAQKKNLRLLAIGTKPRKVNDMEMKRISGGLLMQTRDDRIVTAVDLRVVTKRAPTKAQIADLLFAANVCKHVKSNAIVLAKAGATVGIGAGQTARVDAAEIAIAKAGTRVHDAVLASDAFFPFADGVAVAAAAGITAIIQPGGSIRDSEVIAAADLANIAMVFSGVRAFRH